METVQPRKHPLNVDGKYYTTEDCDGCAYCASVAPDNFDFDKATNAYYVSKQPQTADEEELVREAMEDCPIDAIAMNEPEDQSVVRGFTPLNEIAKL
jgi:ferredoxin